jgi:hypothetical protein
MQFSQYCRGVVISIFLMAATTMGGLDSKSLTQSVKVMERELDVIIPEIHDLHACIRRTKPIPANYNVYQPSVSPDARAIGWWSIPSPYRGEKIPFFWVKSLKEGIQPIWLEGRIPAGHHAISSDGQIIVAIARPYPIQDNRWELLAIDRRSEIAVYDLTQFVTQFELGNQVEVVSVSGLGTLVAVGSRVAERIQVLEIPTGKTVYTSTGRFPRLSPDGKRLAFVNDDRLLIHSFADGTTVQLLKGQPVKGIGGWSPDGRFLLAGAWTKIAGRAKKQIIIDTSLDKYGVIGELGEGNYGTEAKWVSAKLLEQ